MIAEWRKKPVVLLLCIAFCCIPWAQGALIPGLGGYLTISSLCLLVGSVYAAIDRLNTSRPLVPRSFFEIPVVICILVYFAIGLASYFFAAEQLPFLKEAIQRCILILAPLYLFSMGPKRPEDLKKAFYWLMFMSSIMSIIVFEEGVRIGFSAPVYALDLHKNQIAGTCSVTAVIAIACLLTSSDSKRRFMFTIFLVIALLGCVASQGRAGFLCTIVATFFMLIARRASLKQITKFVLSVALVSVAIVHFMPKEVIENATSTKKNSNQVRLLVWTELYPILSRKPFSPVGWGNGLFVGSILYHDVANVLLYDWMQMSILGPLALLSIIFFAIKLTLDNASRMPTNTYLSFVNLIALGIICTRFTHGMLDTFWIGRGCNLCTFMGIGLAVYVKLLLDQQQQIRRLSNQMRAAGPARIPQKLAA